ncbi:hypothetical protein LGN17_27145 [Burkholderia sp. AU30280]|uniref:hypothetical protein n=1 Tax=Burkholderia sp. AU30280 TaxID=2879628 RepID=UPI001CF44013|nr:hypothetical protein [Burkholderia sp. AU30280]MCA8276165.1 hypothetical protein [Burkholderia sp. AU30280]
MEEHIREAQCFSVQVHGVANASRLEIDAGRSRLMLPGRGSTTASCAIRLDDFREVRCSTPGPADDHIQKKTPGDAEEKPRCRSPGERQRRAAGDRSENERKPEIQDLKDDRMNVYASFVMKIPL